MAQPVPLLVGKKKKGEQKIEERDNEETDFIQFINHDRTSALYYTNCSIRIPDSGRMSL